jgi:hypothetical protein
LKARKTPWETQENELRTSLQPNIGLDLTGGFALLTHPQLKPRLAWRTACTRGHGRVEGAVVGWRPVSPSGRIVWHSSESTLMASPSPTTGYRKSTADAPLIRELTFDRLPPGVRACLTRCLAHGGAPRPLLSVTRGPRPPSARTWTVVALAAGLVDLATWVVGFGDRLNAPPLSPPVLALLHAGAVSVALFAALHAMRIRKVHQGVPYPPGLHLFELDLVEVEGGTLRLTPLDTLQRVEARPGEMGPSVALVFADGHEVLFDQQPDAEVLARNAQQAVEAGRRVTLPADLGHLEEVDPFLELRIGDDWARARAEHTPSGAETAGRSLLVRAPTPVLAAAAVALGVIVSIAALMAGREHLVATDDARFEAARGKADLLEGYIEGGGRHLAQAEDELFELRKNDDAHLARYAERGGTRGELAERLLFERQKQKGDREGLARQVERGSRYAAEADDALFELANKSGGAKAFEAYLEKGKRHADKVRSRLLPDAAFAEATASHGVEPLLDFARRFPDSPRASEAKAAAHKIYAGAFDHYTSREHPPPAARAFVQAMLASAEARNDPWVLEKIVVGEMKSGPKTTTPDDLHEPTREHLSGVSTAISRELDTWLSETFPQRVLRVVSPGSDAAKDALRPTIAIHVTPIESGILVSEPEKVRFRSLRFEVDFRATLPGRPEQVSWRDDLGGPKFFDLEVKASQSSPSRADRSDFADKVYRTMAAAVAKAFRKRLEQSL